MTILDLRSDTVTKPTPGMRAAMAAAEVGDDVYGEDPTVNRLQERIAELLGKEAALWAPSGSMANQIALGSLAGPGEEIVCDRHCHVVNYEGGAIGALWGAQPMFVDGARGVFTAAQLEQVLRRTNDDHSPLQRAVAIENTHNRGGGSVWPLQQMQDVARLAHSAGLAVHLDGARLWNAHVATGVPLIEYARVADTVSVCLSKGLGAPAGSVVASTKERVKKMRRLRKRLGGGLRQAGILAAAGSYALDHHLTRLAEDHQSAQRLAAGLAEVKGFQPLSAETNIVLADLDVPGGAPALVAAAREQGVLCNAVGPARVRLVTHLDFPLAAVDDALGRLRKAAAALR
jgi:threonine aldolase